MMGNYNHPLPIGSFPFNEAIGPFTSFSTPSSPCCLANNLRLFHWWQLGLWEQACLNSKPIGVHFPRRNVGEALPESIETIPRIPQRVRPREVGGGIAEGLTMVRQQQQPVLLGIQVVVGMLSQPFRQKTAPPAARRNLIGRPVVELALQLKHLLRIFLEILDSGSSNLIFPQKINAGWWLEASKS